jgi:predicted RNase H-like HicB family nuclease
MTEAEIEERVQELLALPYHKVIVSDPENGYVGQVPELPNCISAGDTSAEALALLEEAMAGWLASAVAHGDPIPEPVEDADHYSGRVLVRMAPALHRRLAEQARVQGVSVNQWLVTLLAQGSGGDAPLVSPRGVISSR